MSQSGHEHRKDLIKPGNDEYLSYYGYQGEWKPTKTIGAIGALSSSPGPAIVYLPSTIEIKYVELFPSHSALFSDENTLRTARNVCGDFLDIVLLYSVFKPTRTLTRDTRQTFSYSPGPAAYDIRKITNKGIDVCHAPIVGEKIEGFAVVTSPGPAAYNRGDCDKMVYTKTPAYSMRPKTEPLKGFVPPAPSTYTLPETLGPGRSPFKKSPAYSIAERLDKTGILQLNPGPAAYQLPSTNVHKPRAPAFSMRMKEKSARFGDVNPGPASNYYHLVKFHKPSTPRYTFGIRHTPFEAFQHFAAEK